MQLIELVLMGLSYQMTSERVDVVSYSLIHQNYNHMTENQRALFSIITDVDWDYQRETNPVKKDEIGKLLREKKLELKLDMGEEAYLEFINAGMKMFAPKK
jgi:hypothetical protein